MLTVVMATHNGAATLPAVMEAYCRLALPAGGHHFVIYFRQLALDGGSD